MTSSAYIMYKKWREQGLCTRCGGTREDPTLKLCETCRTKLAKYNNERSRIYKERAKARKNIDALKKPTVSIAEINRQAKERGVSYGTMVAILEGRIKEGE